MHIVAQGFEADGGRGVTAEAAQLVSSMPYLVGYKPDGELGYLPRNGNRTVHLIAIERDVLPARVVGFRPAALDELARRGGSNLGWLTTWPGNSYWFDARGEAAILLYAMDEHEKPHDFRPFKDVGYGMASYEAIRWLRVQDLAHGYGDRRLFKPRQLINRGELSTLLYRYDQKFGE